MTRVVIINPAAGADRSRSPAARAELARRVLRAHGAADPAVHLTERAGHATELARQAREAGVSLVIAWGGDGTINEVGTALAFGATRLAIVPAGSGNGLARGLGVPLDPEAALAVAANGWDRTIDLGELGGRLFLNVAGIGFDALVAEQFASRPAGRRGRGPYVVSALRELFRYEAQEYDIAAEGTRNRRRALLVAFANGPQYGSGAVIAPRARLDDGALDLVVVDVHRSWRALWDLRRLFAGTLDRAPGVTVSTVREVSVTAAAEMRAHVDGEPFRASGSLEARVHPGALTVRAP